MQTTIVKLGPFSKATHPLKIATSLHPCMHCIKNGLNYSVSSMLPWCYQFLTCLVIPLFADSFTILKGIFHIERLFPHYLYHTYIPSIFLVSLSWSTFWIPSSAVPGRVTLIVTNFLTSIFIFNNVGASKPKVHYKTALEIFGLLNVIFIMLVMVEYVLLLKFPDFMKKKVSNYFILMYNQFW